jgi:hypothetical protein
MSFSNYSQNIFIAYGIEVINVAGVEIVNTIYKYECLIHPLWACMFAAVCFVLAVVGMCTARYDKWCKIVTWMIIPLLLVMIVCLIGTRIKTDKIAEIQYEIVITDNISIDEFDSYYEIVGQNGEIFLVKERQK